MVSQTDTLPTRQCRSGNLTPLYPSPLPPHLSYLCSSTSTPSHSPHLHLPSHQCTHIFTEPPKITGLFEDIAATGETVTFICEVECSIEYNITWLHDSIMLNITEDWKYHVFNRTANQHKLMVTLSLSSDVGIYTCVVNTKFRLKETNASIGFTIPSK